jgi:hypothetical protein
MNNNNEQGSAGTPQERAAVPHWIDTPQDSLGGRTAREGYAANPEYSHPVAQEGDQSESGWCLEKGSAFDPLYLHASENGILDWTPENAKALRFARRADAESMVSIVEDADRVAEHIWIGTTPNAQPTPSKGGEQGSTDASAQALADMEGRKDAAYLERNQVVAALAKCFPSGLARTAIEGWSEDWHGCVYIDLPSGQVSWHFHDSQAYLFDGLPQYTGKWDGHDTPEKYRRVAALSATHPTPSDSASVDTAELNKLAAVFIACVQREQVSAGKVAWQTIIAHIESLIAARVAETRKDAERFGQAIAWEDNVEALHAAVMNNAPDAEAIRREFDAAMAAHSPATSSKEGGAA